ncbi:hypothetical protein C5C13_13900 [Clavibacter michiganensis]|nr:hypothetical protein C5C13_13900 [Clavibacter michiganensis]
MSDDPDDSARAGSAPGPDSDDGRDVAEELVSRLQLIEEQPLGDRAAAFGLLHDELRARLEGGDGAVTRG